MSVSIRSQKGFTLVDMLFVCALIGIISAIALPRLLMAKQSAGAASAIGSMRAVSSGQLAFALSCGGGFYAPKLTTLGVPPLGASEAFISPNLSNADTLARSGYQISMSGTAFQGAPASCNGLGPGVAASAFKAWADAMDADNHRFFATNSDADIWEHTASLAAAIPESGTPPVGHVLQ